MDKFKAVKWVAAAVAGLGADAVVSGVINNNITATTTLEKVLLYAGRFGIGSLVGMAVAKHVEDEIDDIAKTFREAQAESQQVNPKK